MSNAVAVAAKSGGLVAMVNAEVDAFNMAANELGANIAGYFQFSGNTGEWKFNGQIYEHGTAVAINPGEMRKGFVCWKGGKPIARVVERIIPNPGEAPVRLPHKSELKDHGPYDSANDGWTELVELPVRFLDTGTEADISLSSKGGRRALLALGAEWATKSKMNLDDDGQKMIAIVEIGANSFKPKDSPGLKWAPSFKIIAWEPADALAAHLAGEGDDDGEPEPAPSPAPPPPAPPKKPAVGFRPGAAGKRV